MAGFQISKSDVFPELPSPERHCSNASARHDQVDNRDWFTIFGSTLISGNRKTFGVAI